MPGAITFFYIKFVVMKETILQKIEKLKLKMTKVKSFKMTKQSSLHEIITTKEKADSFMKHLKSL